MLNANLIITVCPSLAEKGARRTSWEAIARVLGSSVVFVVDQNHPQGCETVTHTQNARSLFIRISANKYAAGQFKRDAVTLRNLIAEACGVATTIESLLTLNHDPVGLLSSLIDLEEEPVNALRDRYGLIEGKNSWRSADGLLVPVLELISLSIGSLIGITPPTLFPGGKSWAVAFSSDLDVLEDDHLGDVLNFLDRHRVDQPTFMICALIENQRTIRDVHYDVTDAKTLRFTEPLRHAKVEIGLHGSYLAHDRVDWLARQKKLLEQVFERQVRGHRSHFLRFTKRSSWLAQAQAGFDYDATLGYADLPGFRNGCASPIEYRLTDDLKIKVFTTAFLDQHFFWPTRLNDKAFFAMVDPLLAEVSQTGGVITLDWHSYTMRDGNYKGWWDRLEYILRQANQAGAYIGGIGSVSEAFFGQMLMQPKVSSLLTDPSPLKPFQFSGEVSCSVTTNNDKQGHDSKSLDKLVSGIYFDSVEVWRGGAEPYQVQLLQTLKALLGPEKISVLDVGCGNGLITNSLPSHLDVAAIDLSATALRSVKVRKQQGNITALPFRDQSFDFVYCFDVIEHLTEEDMYSGLEELQRVARKHVLVAVPLNEDLASNSVRCVDCGTLYHINGHNRSFDSKWLERLPITDAFERSAIYLSGDNTVPPPNPFIELYWQCSLYPDKTHMNCPQCGSAKVVRPSSNDLPVELTRVINSFKSVEWAKRLQRSDFWCDRSEGMVLLTRKGEKAKLPIPTVTTTQAGCLEINFCNRLQAVENDFVPGSVWPRFKPGKGVKLTHNGIELLDRERLQSSPTMLRFPLLPRPGDSIELHVSSEVHGALSVFGIDGISGAIVRLVESYPIQGINQQKISIQIDAVWALDRFGLAIDLYLFGAARVHNIQYISAITVPTVDTAQVQPGFNLLEVPNAGGLPTYWAFHSSASGVLPVWGSSRHKPMEPIKPVARLLETIWERSLCGKESLLELDKAKNRNNIYLSTLTQTQAELTQTQAELTQTQAELTQTQAELTQMQSIFARSRFFRAKKLVGRVVRYVMGKLRGLKGRVSKLLFLHGSRDAELSMSFPSRWQPADPQSINAKNGGVRVLIVSHMFPHPDQPGLGSFVLEQAQALQRAGVNVCVISGRPIWLTSHRSPLRMLGAIYNYACLYAASSKKWWTIDGVTVRYLPYPILGKFWTHGWTYRFAICRNCRQLQAEFNADMIHAHTGYLDGLTARAMSSYLKLPYVITEHTGPFSMLMENFFIRLATLSAMSKAARVITVSSTLLRDIASYQDLGPVIMKVIPNVVNVEQFYPAKIWEPQPMSPRILFVGYFVPIKNLPLLLDAFQKVLTFRPGAKLMLVGGGEVPGQYEELIASIEQQGLAEAVVVKGYVGRQEVARLMREECDMLVLPSKSETFGCVVAEALASGKPAVITPCGGPEDIVISNWMGEISAANHSAEAFASAILAVVDRLKTFEPHRIRQSAVERFSSDAVATQLKALYDDVLVKSK
jgi:glycosyltransferase involved in cell wall biosynthesis/SAM-dependent methyltransferase